MLSALASVVYTTHLFIAPAKRKFYIAYILVGLTLATGTFLVVATHAPVMQSCTTGLVYLAVVSFGIAAARVKWQHRSAEPRE